MPASRPPRRRASALAAALAVSGLALVAATLPGTSAVAAVDASSSTTTPIKHVVVLFDENVSFDHYFGTYPQAANTDGTTFTAAADTPSVNGYLSDPSLVDDNPNQYDPHRLSPSQALTCDQNHGYAAEQKAMNGGAMDSFVENTESTNCNADHSDTAVPYAGPGGLVMDYYDGNTVTGLWNYAQNYAMSDNSWGGVFGPSTPGALNLIAGQTYGGLSVDPDTGAYSESSSAVQSPDPTTHIGTITNDPDPYYDDCSNKDHTAPSTNTTVQMAGKNVGDLLSEKNVTWGWFQGGFTPSTPSDGTSRAQCGGSTHTNIGGVSSVDYSPHHSPFQYYASTSNPHHLPPSSVDMIGHTDQANHQYDLTSFDASVANGTMPAVSFLKAASYQDGHAGYSDPLDEQHFLVDEINTIQKSPEWSSTAIVIAYDDSDGWYDHAAPTILNGSTDSTVGDQPLCQHGPTAAGGLQDRCGPGPRLPLLVVSPFTAPNSVDHSPTEQSSITRFIEENWSTGRIGGDSLDERAGSLTSLLDFDHPQNRRVILADDGSVSAVTPIDDPTATPSPTASSAPTTSPTTPATSTGSTPTGDPSPTATAAADGSLASTGVQTVGPLVGGGLLLVAGAVLLITRRRKHSL